MTYLKLALMGGVLALANTATAGTVKCTSVGENLRSNRLNIEVTLQTSFFGTGLQEGSLSYTGSSSGESGSGQFACLKPNDKGLVFCGLVNSDINIEKIVSHPVLGFMIQIKGQESVVLFNCN
jgi:hypothetical protein